MPNFVAIGQTVVTISRFWISQDVGSHKLGFLKFYILTAWTVKKDELRHCARFCRKCSVQRRYASFRYFKMAAAAIWDFWNFKILTLGAVKRFEMLHRAKFRQNRSNRGRHIAIFRFFQDGGRPPCSPIWNYPTSIWCPSWGWPFGILPRFLASANYSESKNNTLDFWL